MIASSSDRLALDVTHAPPCLRIIAARRVVVSDRLHRSVLKAAVVSHGAYAVAVAHDLSFMTAAECLAAVITVVLDVCDLVGHPHHGAGG